MSLKMEGEVKFKGLPEIIGKNSSEKQRIVVEEVDGSYPMSIAVDYWNESTRQLNDIDVGDTVEVSYSLTASEWNGKYYQNVAGYKVKILKKGTPYPDKDILPF